MRCSRYDLTERARHAMAQALESPFRERTALVRRSDVAGLVAMGEAELREKLRLKGERPTAG